jgi:ankyrin repeat protein
MPRVHLLASLGDTEALRELLSSRPDLVTRRDPHDHDNTPLLLAVKGGHMDATRLLLEHGADANTENRMCISPLLTACLWGHEQVRVPTTQEETYTTSKYKWNSTIGPRLTHRAALGLARNYEG